MLTGGERERVTQILGIVAGGNSWALRQQPDGSWSVRLNSPGHSPLAVLPETPTLPDVINAVMRILGTSGLSISQAQTLELVRALNQLVWVLEDIMRRRKEASKKSTGTDRLPQR